MVFSSKDFLWLFLPIVLTVYYMFVFIQGVFKDVLNFSVLTFLKNITLIIASLVFYSFGQVYYLYLIIGVSLIAYIFGLIVDKTKKKAIMLLSVVVFLSILGWYKYSGFVVSQLDRFLKLNIPVPTVILPIGISFFTFQAMSYVFDVYFGKVKSQKNPLYLLLYISLFPQLIAGPIVRYEDIEIQITERKESLEKFSSGMERFLWGLMKKVLIANNCAVVADFAFGLFEGKIFLGSTTTAWLGAIAYTLQIYFDFSGYSDMAIGLGKMFGFDFMENFRFPYSAVSVTDFWRRWHISLSVWFRDYVYIPLGGSRCSKVKTLRNLFVVWLLTGIWHGANWTFILWGIMYFILLALEKTVPALTKNKIISRIYTLLFVIVGWVIFRSFNTGQAISYILAMAGKAPTLIGTETLPLFVTEAVWILVGVVFCFPYKWMENKKFYPVKVLFLVLGAIVAMSYIFNEAYSPFIYFNF